MNRANLLQRVLFAAWAIPVTWVVANWDRSLVPPDMADRLFGVSGIAVYPGQILGALVVFLGCVEYLRMLAQSYPRNGFWLIYLWLGVQTATFVLPDAFRVLRAFAGYDMYILLLIVGAESIIWGRYTSRWKRASLLFSGTVFLSYACLSLINYYREPFQVIFPARSPMLVSQMGIVTVLTAVFMCDTAAFFAGSLWGRHHFSDISPRKTIEGSVAGLAAAVLIGTAGWAWFADPRYPVWLGVVMGLLVGVAAQAGDLLVSTMKRYFQVKDASNLIPGHGGILDRCDSLFFTAPILNLFFIAVDKFS